VLLLLFASAVEKCSCIPHLLRTLVSIVQHVTDADVGFPASELRSKLLIRVFRLSLSILKARCEPWLTFINSPSDVNRLFTILTTISEVAVPKAISHQIDGNYDSKVLLVCLSADVCLFRLLRLDHQ